MPDVGRLTFKLNHNQFSGGARRDRERWRKSIGMNRPTINMWSHGCAYHSYHSLCHRKSFCLIK